MLIKLAVFLCLASTITATRWSEATQSPVFYSTPAPPIDVSTFQPYYDIPLEAKVLQSKFAQNFQQQQVYSSQQLVPQFQETSSGQTYINNPSAAIQVTPAIVKNFAPVPVENKVTVEAHQHVTVHPPTVNRVSSQPVPVAVQPLQYHIQTVNRPAAQYVSAPVGFSQSGQFASRASYETVTVQPPSATFVTSTPPPQPIQYEQTFVRQPAVNYVSAPALQSEVVNTVPVTEKETIESHQSVTAHPPTAGYVTAGPVNTQTVNRPSFQLFSSPDRQTVQTSNQYAFRGPTRSVTVYPPSPSYVTSTPSPLPIYRVQNVINRPFVGPKVSPRVQIPSNTAYETVTAYPPSAAYITSTEAPLTVQNVQTVVNRPAVQYISQVKPQSDTVTIEAHQSVTAHPPTSTVAPIQQVQTVENPSFQYVAGQATSLNTLESTIANQAASRIQYARSTPIPVPVYFTAEEAQQPQFSVTKYAQTSPVIVNQEVPVAFSQPIPVPVLYPKSESFVKYNQVSTPVVYSKSIVEKDHVSADLVATHNVNPGVNGYARAVAYSPATAVSSVSFNGLGVSYGW